MPNDNIHKTEVRKGHDHEDPDCTPLFEPACVCGWVGRQVTSRGDAQQDADEHTIAMAGEPIS